MTAAPGKGFVHYEHGYCIINSSHTLYDYILLYAEVNALASEEGV